MKGGEASAFYLLRDGKVALEICPQGSTPIPIQTLGNGDVLGWSSLVPPYRWRLDAQAITLTHALALDGNCLRRKCQSDSDLSFWLLTRFSRVMVDHLQAARRLLPLIKRKRKVRRKSFKQGETNNPAVTGD